MDKNTKILLVVCLILLAGLGVTSGVLMNKFFFQKPTKNISVQSSNITNTTQTNAEPSWHYVQTLSGTNANHGDTYTLKGGKKVKILLTATPEYNLDPSSFVLAVYHDQAEGDIANLDWAADESSKSKSTTLYPKLDSKYEMRVGPHNIKTWKIEVYEYY